MVRLSLPIILLSTRVFSQEASAFVANQKKPAVLPPQQASFALSSTTTRTNFAGTPSNKQVENSNSNSNDNDNDNKVVDLLDSNFQALFHSETPLLIDAYATFCGPCRLIEPVIQSCAQNWASSDLVVSRWNVEALQTDIKIELLLQGANPTKLPTLILVHQGKAKKIHSGLITEDQLDDLLSQHYLPLKTVGLTTTSTTTKRKDPAKEEEMWDTIREASSESPSSSSSSSLKRKKSGFISFGAKEDDYMLTALERR